MECSSRLSEYLAICIVNQFGGNEIYLQKIKYGIQSLMLSLSKISTLMLIAYFLGIIKYVAFFLISFSVLKTFAFGTHASTSLRCTITTLTIFITGTYLGKYLIINTKVFLILYIICLVIFYKYAPADTKARPILSKKLRRKLRIKTLIAASILLVVAMVIPNGVYRNLILFAAITESVCITPLTYKILKKEYRNYESYQSRT